MSIQLNGFEIGNDSPLTVMGGVNVLENEDLVMRVAESFKEATEKIKLIGYLKDHLIKQIEVQLILLEGLVSKKGLKYFN